MNHLRGNFGLGYYESANRNRSGVCVCGAEQTRVAANRELAARMEKNPVYPNPRLGRNSMKANIKTYPPTVTEINFVMNGF